MMTTQTKPQESKTAGNGNPPGASTQIVPRVQRAASVRDMLVARKDEIARALPRHLHADRMLRVALTSIQRTPKLLECSPASLYGAILTAAQLGLEPDGVLGMAYLVPFKNQCQLIVGYKGLVDLARRSGQLSTIYAKGVHAGDAFEYAFGLDPRLEHIPGETGGELTHAYAVAVMRDGGKQFDVMTRADVESIRSRSRAGNEGPWVTDYEQMAQKTVLRRLCKLLPCSVELARAVALDERAEIGLPQHLEDAAPQLAGEQVAQLEAETREEREPGEEG
jgi:recombination protein RecT